MRDLNLSKQTSGGARQTSVDMLETSQDMLCTRGRHLEMFGRRRGTSGKCFWNVGETTGGMGDMLRMPRGVCETSGDVRATSEDV